MNFILYMEMSDAFTADISNVNLIPTSKGYHYPFIIDNVNYAVDFPQDVTTLSGLLPPTKYYTVNFSGPNSFQPTYNNPKPTPVYAELIKALRKLMQIANPPILKFNGATPEQDRIYLRIHHLFLKYHYTKLQNAFHQYYVRNDIHIPDKFKYPMPKDKKEFREKMRQIKQAQQAQQALIPPDEPGKPQDPQPTGWSNL